jgi:acyl-CoA synthetase (AMP-forming)/AMP-acid ligase II
MVDFEVTPEITLGEALEQMARRFPEREALVFAGQRVTFRQWDDKTNSLVPQFEALGVGKGDRVGVMLPSVVELPIVVLALAKIGAISVMVNPMLGAQAIRHTLADAGASVLVMIAGLMKRDLVADIEGMRSELPGLRHVILMGQPREGYANLHAMLAVPAPEGGSFVREGVEPDDMVALLYTGGSTGLSKGVPATSYNLLYVDAVNDNGSNPDDVMLQIPPLFLTFGFRSLALPLLYGMKLVGLSGFDPRVVLQSIQDEKVTQTGAYPTMFAWLMSVPGFDEYDVSSVRLIGIGGEPITTELVNQIREKFSCTTTSGYGMTEMRGITATDPDDPPEISAHTDGKAIGDLELKLTDSSRQEVAFGDVGEIAVRGRAVFEGYWNKPELNAQVFDADGFFYTGDLARFVTKEGHIRFVGRQKDTIRRGGMTIYPEEIENYLRTHPKIARAGVIGVPGQVAGERIRAYVQLHPGVEMTPTEVVDYCRGGLAAHTIPAEVRFVESLPLSGTQRVMRWKLREMAAEESK